MTTTTDAYRELLERKAPIAIDRGLTGKFQMRGDLKPHARDVARWMIRGGNRACFANCQLGVRREFMPTLFDLMADEA